MSQMILSANRGLITAPGNFGIEEPISPSLDEAILSFDPYVYWPMRSSQGSGLSDVMNNVTLQLANGNPVTGYPTICDPDTGDMLAFNMSSSSDRLAAPDNSVWNEVPLTIIVHGVSMNLGAKNILVARGTNGVGSIGIELLANGQPRFFFNNDTGLIDLRGSASDVEVGESVGMALVIESTGIRGYWKIDGGAIEELEELATIATPALTDQLFIGAYNNGASPFVGPLGRIAIYRAALTEANIDDLLLPVNVTYAHPISAGAVTEETTLDVDVLSSAIYRGSPTVAVSTQPDYSTASVVSNQVRITAGTTAGADTLSYTVNSSSPATIDFTVTEAFGSSDERNLGQWFGSFGWGASAGNFAGIGRVYSHAGYRWEADRSGSIDTIRFDTNHHRFAEGYGGGTGGNMRLTIRSDNGSGRPVMTGGGILWQSQLFVGMSSPPPPIVRIDAGKIEVPITPLAVTAGTTYHFIWTNEHSNVTDNWYIVNNMHNHSLPLPYHPYPPWQTICSLTSTNGGSSFGERNRWIPYFLIRYTDGVYVGQPVVDGGTTNNIMSISGSNPGGVSSKAGNSREIGGNWQIRQRWTHDSDTVTMNRFRGRIWKRNSSTAHGLRVRVEEEEGGGVITLADVTIPATSFFTTNWDNVEGILFDPIDVSLGGNVILENGKTYRLRLSTANDATRYAIRAPNGGSKSVMNIGWGAWLGRGEYSTDGGLSWTGMHHYDQDDRSTNDWNMALYNNGIEQLFRAPHPNDAFNIGVGSGANYADVPELAAHTTGVFNGGDNKFGIWTALNEDTDPLRTISGTGANLPITSVRMPNNWPPYETGGEASILVDRATGISHSIVGQTRNSDGSVRSATIARPWPIADPSHGTTLNYARRGTSASGIANLKTVVRTLDLFTPGNELEYAIGLVVPRGEPGNTSPAILGRGIKVPAGWADFNAHLPGINIGPLAYGDRLAIRPTYDYVTAIAGMSTAGMTYASTSKEIAVRFFRQQCRYGCIIVDGGAQLNFRIDTRDVLAALGYDDTKVQAIYNDLKLIIQALLWPNLKLVTNAVTGATAILSNSGGSQVYSGSIGTLTNPAGGGTALGLGDVP